MCNLTKPASEGTDLSMTSLFLLDCDVMLVTSSLLLSSKLCWNSSGHWIVILFKNYYFCWWLKKNNDKKLVSIFLIYIWTWLSLLIIYYNFFKPSFISNWTLQEIVSKILIKLTVCKRFFLSKIKNLKYIMATIFGKQTAFFLSLSKLKKKINILTTFLDTGNYLDIKSL